MQSVSPALNFSLRNKYEFKSFPVVRFGDVSLGGKKGQNRTVPSRLLFYRPCQGWGVY